MFKPGLGALENILRETPSRFLDHRAGQLRVTLDMEETE